MVWLVWGLMPINAQNGSSYCTWQANSYYEFIHHVSVGAISNTSGNDGGYGDYTNLITDLGLGQTHGLAITPGFSSCTYYEYVAVYIDYNQDGTFDENYELAYANVYADYLTINGEFVVPNDALPGNTRMRIVMYWDDGDLTYNNTYPCGSFAYGEAEDYSVNIVNQVSPQCEASFAAWINGPNEMHFCAYPSATTAPIVSTSWTANGTVFAENETYTNMALNSNENYTICLTIVTADECSDEYCETFNLECNADFVAQVDPNNDFNVSFEGLFSSTDPNNEAYWWLWSFGDGGYQEEMINTQHLYNQTGVFEVCLEAYFTNACTSVTCQMVEIIDNSVVCVAGFEWMAIDNEIVVNDGSVATGNIVTWNYFLDGVLIADVPSTGFLFVNGQNYELCLNVITNDGCSNVYCENILIDCNAGFNVDVNGMSVLLSTTTETFSGETYIVDWDFGNGDGLAMGYYNEEIVYNFDNEGTYQVCLSMLANDGCTDSTCQTVVVLLPVCNRPTNVVATTTSEGMLMFDWDANPNALSYHYSLFVQGADTLINDTITNTTVLLDGLEPCTPYSFKVETNCDFGLTSPYEVLNDLYVDDNCVWPGDVDWDNDADMDDLLAWGLVPMTATGESRVNASTDWIAQTCNDWAGVQTNGVNAKHTDCDGNGLKEMADVEAIVQNFQATHNGNDANKLMMAAALLQPQPINVGDYTADGINDTIFFNMNLSDPTGNAIEAYGLRYEVKYSQFTNGGGNVINAESWFDESWLGIQNDDMVGRYKTFQNDSVMFVGQTRTDQQNATGTGAVSRIGCLIEIDIVEIVATNPYSLVDLPNGKIVLPEDYVPVVINIENARLITANNIEIPIETQNDTVWVLPHMPDVVLETKVMLEGAYNVANDAMVNSLQNQNLLPTNQPFNRPPWDYTGNEMLMTDEANVANVIDWVLLELRNENHVVLEQKAALLLEDGWVVSADSLNIGTVTTTGLSVGSLRNNENYFLCVRHRNHLDVITTNSLTVNNNTLVHDFTNDATLLAINQLKNIDGTYVFYAGDIDGNGVLNYGDFNFYKQHQSLSNDYIRSDLNFDGNVTVNDFDDYFTNVGVMGVNEVRY